jgi:hypothetical protein
MAVVRAGSIPRISAARANPLSPHAPRRGAAARCQCGDRMRPMVASVGAGPSGTRRRHGAPDPCEASAPRGGGEHDRAAGQARRGLFAIEGGPPPHAPPDALRALGVHTPVLGPWQRGDPGVAAAAIPGHQRHRGTSRPRRPCTNSTSACRGSPMIWSAVRCFSASAPDAKEASSVITAGPRQGGRPRRRCRNRPVLELNASLRRPPSPLRAGARAGFQLSLRNAWHRCGEAVRVE